MNNILIGIPVVSGFVMVTHNAQGVSVCADHVPLVTVTNNAQGRTVCADCDPTCHRYNQRSGSNHTCMLTCRAPGMEMLPRAGPLSRGKSLKALVAGAPGRSLPLVSGSGGFSRCCRQWVLGLALASGLTLCLCLPSQRSAELAAVRSPGPGP